MLNARWPHGKYTLNWVKTLWNQSLCVTVKKKMLAVEFCSAADCNYSNCKILLFNLSLPEFWLGRQWRCRGLGLKTFISGHFKSIVLTSLLSSGSGRPCSRRRDPSSVSPPRISPDTPSKLPRVWTHVNISSVDAYRYLYLWTRPANCPKSEHM